MNLDLFGILLGVMVTQFALLWYKMGRVEGHLRELNNLKRRDKDG